jgi:hypothetical protein
MCCQSDVLLMAGPSPIRAMAPQGETYILTDIDAYMRTYTQCMRTWMHARTRKHAACGLYVCFRLSDTHSDQLAQTNSPQDAHHRSPRCNCAALQGVHHHGARSAFNPNVTHSDHLAAGCASPQPSLQIVQHCMVCTTAVLVGRAVDFQPLMRTTVPSVCQLPQRFGGNDFGAM